MSERRGSGGAGRPGGPPRSGGPARTIEIGQPKVGRVVLVASVAAMGGFLFGFDTAVINGAVGAVAKQFNVGPVRLGLSVSAALLGSAVGAIIAGRLADRFGRVPTMIMAAVTFLIQSIGVGFSFTVYDFSVWRFIGGGAVGGAPGIAPPPIARGAPAFAFRGLG